MHRFLKTDWLYWAATVPLLAGGLYWKPAGIYLAMGLCAIQIAHFGLLSRSPVSFPVQVRGTYVAMLAAGLWPPLAVLHWIQLIGTSTRVMTGYCLLARLLSLFPWNRNEKLSVRLLSRRLFQRDHAGHTACTQFGCASGR